MTCVTMKVTIREWYENNIESKNFLDADYAKYLIRVSEANCFWFTDSKLGVLNYKALVEKILLKCT